MGEKAQRRGLEGGAEGGAGGRLASEQRLHRGRERCEGGKKEVHWKEVGREGRRRIYREGVTV